jgi:hypothetical protein
MTIMKTEAVTGVFLSDNLGIIVRHDLAASD